MGVYRSDSGVVLASVEPAAVAALFVLVRLVGDPGTETHEAYLSVLSGVVVQAGIEVVDDPDAVRVGSRCDRREFGELR